MKEDTRKFNLQLVGKAIENSKSLRIFKGSLSVGKEYIFSLKGKDGTVPRNRGELLRGV